MRALILAGVLALGGCVTAQQSPVLSAALTETLAGAKVAFANYAARPDAKPDVVAKGTALESVATSALLAWQQTGSSAAQADLAAAVAAFIAYETAQNVK
jgi:hypothetical protein